MGMNEEARLVKENMGLVYSLVRKKYLGYGVPEEDLVQEGALGLLQAIRKFDASKDASLGTYATYWIKAYVRKAIGLELLTTDHNLDRWEKNGRQTFKSSSLDESVRFGNYDADATLHDILPNAEPSPESLAERLHDRQRLDKAITRLSPRAADVIASRFDGDETLDTVGTRLGVSRERVRQIEAGALEHLGKALAYGW